MLAQIPEPGPGLPWYAKLVGAAVFFGGFIVLTWVIRKISGDK